MATKEMTRDQKLAALAEAPQEFCLKALKDKNMHVAAKALNRLLKIEDSSLALYVSLLNFGELHKRFGEFPMLEGMQKSLATREAAIVTKVKLAEYLEEQKKELKVLKGKLRELEVVGHKEPDLNLAYQKQAALMVAAADALIKHKIPELPGWMMRCVRYAKARWNQHGDPSTPPTLSEDLLY